MDEVLQAKFVEKCELEHIRTADEVARVNNIKRYASDVTSGSWHVVVSKQTVGVAVTADAGHLFNVQLDSTQYSSNSRSEQSVENANRGHRNRQGPYHLVHGRYVAWRHAADPPPFQLSNLVPSPKTFSLVMLIAAFIFGVAYLWQARSILPDPSDPCEPNPRDPTHPRPHAHSCMLHRRFRATPRSLQVRNASSIRGLD